MTLHLELARAQTRRQFLKNCQTGIGAIALTALLQRDGRGSPLLARRAADDNPMTPRQPHFAPKAKSVICLHMSGAPPQHDLFDYKPKLVAMHMKPCPDELLKNQRFAFIKGHPKLLGTPYHFKQHGKSGAWISELLPNLSAHADRLAFVKSMNTDQFNHAPAAPRWDLGSPTVWAPRIRICRVSWCSSAAAPTRPAARRCGAPAFCPRSSRACSAGRPAIRSCTSTTPRAWTGMCVAKVWMPSAS